MFPLVLLLSRGPQLDLELSSTGSRAKQLSPEDFGSLLVTLGLQMGLSMGPVFTCALSIQILVLTIPANTVTTGLAP